MPHVDPTLSQAERIDRACDRFEADWRAGRPPRIDDLVDAAPEAERAELRSALLGVERELQARSVSDTSVSRESVNSADGTVHHAGESLPASIARFEVRAVIAAGAFGRVYRAFDPQLGREVAIKVPLDAALGSATERSRFLKEARAAATINHANVCQIHEVGEHAGRPYIVMALVPGQSLADVLKARTTPLPAKQAANVVRRIALGLAAAHEKGIVHRDLKPANVMFDRERKDVIVMDFGLARGPRLGDARGTQSGVIMGTPAYMSPEQARGDSKDVGPAGDIYGLGVILYELLTGTRPFKGTATEVIGQILHVEPEEPRKRNANVDPRLEEACLKAMAKDPAKRFATMREFAAAMDRILRSPTGPAAETAKAGETRRATEESRSDQMAEMFAALSMDRKATAAAVEDAIRRHRTPLKYLIAVGIALVASLLALGGIVFFTKSDKVKVTIELTDIDLADKTLTFFLDDEPIAAEALANPVELKPGEHVLVVKRGKTIVKRVLLTVTGGRSPGIRYKDITPEPPPPPPPTKPGLTPSPLDVLQAKDIPNDDLRRIFGDASKAPPELVAVYTNLQDDPKGDDVFWSISTSSNGKLLATSHYPWTIIEIHDLVTGKKFGDAATQPGGWVTWNRISPDNRSIYYVRKDGDLFGADIDGKVRWRKAIRSDNFQVPALSPDGSVIAAPVTDGATPLIRLYDARTGDTKAEWKDALDGPGGRLCFSPDGKVLAVNFGGKARMFSGTDGKPLDFPVLSNIAGDPVFGRDGKKLYTSHHWKNPDPYCIEHDVATGKQVEYRHAPNGCRMMLPNPVHPLLVSNDEAGGIHLWEADKGPDQKPKVIDIGGKPGRYTWTPEGRYLIVGSENRIMVLRILPLEG